MTLTVTNIKNRLSTTAHQFHRWDISPDEAHRIFEDRDEAHSFIVTHVWVIANGRNGDTIDFVDELEVIAYGFEGGQRGDYVNGLNHEFSRKWHSSIGRIETQFSAMPDFIYALIRDDTPLGSLFDSLLENPKFYLSDPNHPDNIAKENG